MPPNLPTSLSPHICIVQSQDLQQVLVDASLPPLPQLLHCFCPLSQVNTRTTTLNTVPHASFALRFSDLAEVEATLHEDEEQRAGRTLDWIGTRIGARSARWVELVERKPSPVREDRTPWWEEVKRCVEGEYTPNRYEGWNHPTAVIYAVSTLAANPLQALQDMQTRPLDLPVWVDKTFLRYYLIVHPSNSSLSDPIAESLFNAVKKQYGLHSYLLQVDFPTTPPPQPVPVPLPVPRLPPLSLIEMSPMPQSQMPAGLAASPMPTSPMPTPGIPLPPRSPDPSSLIGEPPQVRPGGPGTLSLGQEDIQEVGRFIREFLVMSLIPWMEKCVLEWNESYSSSRRLPSRLFSSTRRLFGSGAPAASAPGTPTHGSTASVSSVTSRFAGHAPSSSVTSLSSVSSVTGSTEGLVTQQRRLAEFATILGDYKLAITVWETLRKDSKGGSDILPLLVAPSPALALHASNAISALQTIAAEKPALAQLRALTYAIRWEIGIDSRDFLSTTLEGERWLVQAAGAAEEPPTALLLAHAAFLTSKKSALRRAALWYLSAADRLEKAGIKPLALYLFRQAHQLYQQPTIKDLSPSFWESEDRQPSQWKGFDGVLPGIEHELGRLLYTTGDTEGAVKYFIGLLHEPVRPIDGPTGLGLVNDDGSQSGKASSTDRVYLEDFRVALKHFRTTEQQKFESLALELPITFSRPIETRLRLPGNAMDGDPENWKRLEDDWASFWRPRGQERLQSGGKASVEDPFWVDLVVRNPLNVEVTFSGLTAVVKDAQGEESLTPDFVEVEVIDDLTLDARESRTIPIAVKCSKPAVLAVTHVKFLFLSLLPVTESLAVRGRRLHDTPHQRQNKVYAPDILLKVEVEDSGYRLHTSFVDNRHLSLFQGECKHMDVRIHNSGKRSIDELWIVSDSTAEVWVDSGTPDGEDDDAAEVETFQSDNCLTVPQPRRLDLGSLHSGPVLDSGQDLKLPLLMHVPRVGDHDLCLLVVYRQAGDNAFHSTRLTRHYEVHPILDIAATPKAGPSPGHPYAIDMNVVNVAPGSVRLTQVTALSQIWSCSSQTSNVSTILPAQQSTRITVAASRCDEDSNAEEIRRFVYNQLRAVIQGEVVPQSSPPPTQLHCNHLTKGDHVRRANHPAIRYFIEHGRRNIAAASLLAAHPHIPAKLHPHLFPIFNPAAVDFLVFWEIPSHGRSGHCLITGVTLGATHAPLTEIIEEAESAKSKRSMYAETRRERMEMLEAIRKSEWNAEVDPLVVTPHDGQQVQHDFSKGPLQVPVAFTVRNVSLTNPVRFTFRLSAVPIASSAHPNLLPPQYTGRLTHRGELAASQTSIVRAKLTVDRPGCYALNSWVADIEVGELSGGDASWKVRQRYQQQALAADLCSVTVVDASR